MGQQHTPTEPTDYGAELGLNDVVSDPAQGEAIGSDWAAEGGAVTTGPATDTGDADSDATDTKPLDPKIEKE